MQYRKAQNKDLAALVRLQNQNSIVVDPNLDHSDGVLRSSFSVEDFAALNRDLGITVCIGDLDASAGKKNPLLGFACASTPEFNRHLGLPSAMITRFDKASYEGRLLSQWQCAVAGPVCVEKVSRGTGIFEGLYAHLLDILPDHYELLVALVSTQNPRSIAAHKKIGMIEVDEFVYNGTNYFTIAKKIGISEMPGSRREAGTR